MFLTNHLKILIKINIAKNISSPLPILNHTFAAAMLAWRGFGDYFPQ
jgi:hypothetical protein